MTEPYYQDDLVTLYRGDCLEHPEWWVKADVLVTDPPYGMNYQSNQRRTSGNENLAPIRGDRDTSVRDCALALWGGVRPALVFGHWSVPAPAGERQRLIWWKEGNPGMGDLSIPWGPAHEEIHLLGRGWDREATGLPRIGSVISTRGVRGGSAGEENQTGHPTPKPVPLMEALIVRTPDGLIADPFAGAGATLIAAKLNGRRAVGVELEERYCEMAARRLAQDAFDLGQVVS